MRRIERAVETGLRRWADAQPAAAPDAAGDDSTDITLPQMREVRFQAGWLQVLGRFRRYLGAALRWYSGRARDFLAGQDTLERRAIRLRQIIERMGGVAVKVGQQAAMRMDLLAPQYGIELTKLLDDMDPFPAAEAVRAVERQIGGPLHSVFATFEEQPIGSASVACVYRAVLHNGETVAVKVRRPGIGEKFDADCRALAWVLAVMEFFNLLRHGLSRNFLFEFRTMLTEELNFVKEARYGELFRRRVEKKLDNVTAPRVYFELSGVDVLVTEWVAGEWVKNIIAGLERGDPAYLAKLRAQNIDPGVVARRLIRINQFGIFENLLFHADPHPSNILVRPNNELVFIDFGACGAYTTAERNNWRQLAYYHDREDIGRMAQCALAILEPLPHIEIDEFRKRLEAVFWQDLYAFKSRHSEWWERTSVGIWISFLNLAREYEIPMNLNTLRMIRSTLLYETVAARLYPRIDAYREHRQYNKSAGRRARRRVRRTIHKRLFEGLTRADYLRVEDLLGMGNRIGYLLQRQLDLPGFHFSLLASKAVHMFDMIYRTVAFGVAGMILLVTGTIGYRMLFRGYGIDRIYIWSTCLEVLQSRWLQVFLLLLLWLHVHRAIGRFRDKEIRSNNTTGLT